MESTEDSLSSCLLQWVQSFERIGKAETLKDLGDGLAIWRILQDVDNDYFTGDVPEPEVNTSSDWTRKWQNLKHVDKQLSMYYRDICNGQEHMDAATVPDLKAIAAEESVRDTEKLIMTIIRAAMASPESNQRMAQRLMSLGRENAMMIANELRNMEESDYTESEPASRVESPYPPEQEQEQEQEQETPEKPRANGTKSRTTFYEDPMLEREEELLQAQATITKLQASQEDAQRQLEELRRDKESLQEAFDSYRGEIDTKGRKAVGDDAFKKLQRQTDNDKSYIDDLENQLQSSRNAIENYERQLQRHRDEGEGSQKLRDDIQMLKTDNEDLNQKIKANENLKKKIQTLQEQEKANTSLREEVRQANERLEELDRLKQVQASLEKEVIEKKGLIRNQEYQINELTTTRKHAEYDARVLAQKLQEAKDRHDRDHEAIQELKGKLQESNLDDTTTQDEEPLESSNEVTETEQKITAPRNDENKHLVEKLALLEQQLEAADIRLKQSSERNAALEEQHQGSQSDTDARQKAERQIEQHEIMITSLRKELDMAKKQKSEMPPASEDVASLQRENHLMSTAWFDLSSRLQNNGISLGRRRQEPKSWIGKQRALVGPNNGLQR